ncbi:cache domain-containing protein [Candidatus Parabeggiatoa sp. HSG14]|uniref:cache domain-containing protein n=1 Tax=Candidatus Parabeggiatoa sp. HSG14 TaxID=3055593 RepID=UPI0025A8A2CC|nr:cache domain-containing protein [Thiotrichales bacterium HSG14]
MNTPFLKISFFHSLRGKLILLFLVVLLIPLILEPLTYIQAKNALKTEVINKLIAVRDIKTQQIENFFNDCLKDVKLLSKHPSIIAAMESFEESIHKDMTVLGADETEIMKQYRSLYMGKPNLENSNDDSAYSAIHAQYHFVLKAYKETHDYYDIFLVEPHAGTILYTVEKENDYGTDLKDGPYVDTNIGHVFKKALVATHRDFTILEDFAYYAPSKKAASFVASPIFDDSQKIIGLLIFQLSTNQINAIMQENSGLGQTGETILVSSDDFLLRSDSRFSEKSTLLKQKVNTEATRAAAIGEEGVKEILDYRGKKVIIAYKPIHVSNVRWSLNAKIDKAEAFVTMQKMWYEMLIITILGILIGIALAFRFSYSIIKPIRVMTNVAHQLALGNINQTIEVKSRDEIGLMGNAFNQMIINLWQVIEDIVQVSQGLANGNLHVMPQSEYRGELVQIKNALETALSNQRQVVEDIVQVSQKLMQGKLDIKFQAKYEGDFIYIKTALETALSDQQKVITDIVKVSQGLAEGNLDVTPTAKKYKGDFIQIQNAIETTSISLRQVIENIVQVSYGLAEGNFHTMPDKIYQGNFVKVKNALESTAARLAETSAENTMQNWLKTGQAQLNDKMSGEQDMITLAKNIIVFLTTQLEAQVGLFYLVENINRQRQTYHLNMLAYDTHTQHKNVALRFHFSENLVGQAALEKQMITFTINSGLEKTIPSHLAAVPFLYEDSVKGVIELGFSETMSEIQEEFLGQAMSSIGIAVNTAESRAQMQTLLEQKQSEKLQN